MSILLSIGKRTAASRASSSAIWGRDKWHVHSFLEATSFVWGKKRNAPYCELNWGTEALVEENWISCNAPRCSPCQRCGWGVAVIQAARAHVLRGYQKGQMFETLDWDKPEEQITCEAFLGFSSGFRFASVCAALKKWRWENHLFFLNLWRWREIWKTSYPGTNWAFTKFLFIGLLLDRSLEMFGRVPRVHKWYFGDAVPLQIQILEPVLMVLKG